MSENVPMEWGSSLVDKALDDALIAKWHTTEMIRGVAYPVLSYVARSGNAITEPCIYCGTRHHHGVADGSRVPHCGDHTHEFDAQGRRMRPGSRRRAPWIVPRCHVFHRDYILRRAPIG